MTPDRAGRVSGTTDTNGPGVLAATWLGGSAGRSGTGYHVNVAMLDTGLTDTPALRKIPGNEKLIEIATQRNPHHRLTTPADLGGAIVALSHPGADWITGNVINVDGGEEVSA